MTAARMTTADLVGRVAGLAVALGAGVVISLAVSAPAAADSPRGGPDSPSAEHAAASTPRAGSPSSRANRATVGRTARPAATVTTRTIRNSAPSAKPGAKVSPVAPAAASPGLALPAAAVPTAPTPVGAEQPRSLRSLSGRADPRGRLITIYQGTHFAIPNSFGFFIKQVSGTGTFTPNTVYDLQDEDQYDWNKFTGIAFTPLEPDRNSVMVGWRYNLRTAEFEIAPFYNVDKKRILPNELTEVISVPADETFDYLVDYTGVTISYGGRTVFKPYPEGLTPRVWTAARVSGWFGGNEVAPRTVSYYLKLNR